MFMPCNGSGNDDRNCSSFVTPWIAAIVCFSLTGSVALGGEKSGRATHLLDWRQLAELPQAVHGPLVGVSDGALVVAGGQTLAESAEMGQQCEVPSDLVFVLEPDAEHWRTVNRLNRPVADGQAVTTDEGIVCIGGRDAQRCRDEVFLIRWKRGVGRIEIENLPDLPGPLAMFGAAEVEGVIYVAGGQQTIDTRAMLTCSFWALDLSSRDEIAGGKGTERAGWKELPSWPGPARTGPIAVAQDGSFCLIGGIGQAAGQLDGTILADAYRYHPKARPGQRWRRIAEAPRAVAAAPASPFGPTGILLLGGLTHTGIGQDDRLGGKPRLSSEILAYDTITDTWTRRGTMPAPVAFTAALAWQGRFVTAGGQQQLGHSSGHVLEATPLTWQSNFRTVDQLVLIGYFLLLVVIGWYFSGREKSIDDYLLGGRRVPWWAAGLSILATQVSSIGFMAVPAKSYATNWVYFAGVATWFVAVPIVIRYYLPFFRRLHVTTAYEYLEWRFNLVVRLYGSSIFMLLQLGRIAIVVYLPAIALSVVTGMNVYYCILVMGVLSTIYTVMGGIEAVIWTDVLQTAILMGGALLAVLIALFGIEGGFTQFLEISSSDAKFHFVDWNWDIAAAGLWVVLAGNALQRLTDLTSDQTVVQRYLTTRDEKQTALALWANVAASIPWAILVFMLGTALYAFFKTRPELLNPALQTDAIVPWFIVQQLPAGISGLVIAALFATAMSSLDSSIHSMATTLVTDFYGRLGPRSSDQLRLKLARWLTALLGVVGTGAALLMATFQVQSLWDLFMTIAGLATGGLGGLFVLGIFTRRANSPGAIAGALVSAVVLYLVKTQTHVHFFLYVGIGMLTCVAVGYSVSLLFPVGSRSINGLTIYTMDQEVRK